MTRSEVARRSVLTGTALACAETLAACGVPGRRSGSVVVLVHGAWHSSSAWAEVASALVLLGVRVLAVDLPGAGPHTRLPVSYLAENQRGLDTEVSPLRDLTVEDAADSVLAAVRGLRDNDPACRIVLVAHSLGGVAITRAAERAPELVDELVYVAALVPTVRGSAAAYLRLPEAGPRYPGLYVGDPSAIGATRINPRSTDPAYRGLLHRTFYGDVDDQRFLAFACGLVPDNPLGIAGATVGATAARWGSIRRSYVMTAQDRVVTPALQQVMIDDANRFAPARRFRTTRIDSSHSPFASQPSNLARIIAEVTT